MSTRSVKHIYLNLFEFIGIYWNLLEFYLDFLEFSGIFQCLFGVSCVY